MQRLVFRAMGCRMLAVLDADGPAAGHLERVPQWFAEWEQCLSRFRADSELSALNRHAGEPVAVSATLWSVLCAARRAAQASDGLVTPTLLGALEAAGYDRSFERLAAAGPGAIDNPARPAPPLAIECDLATRTITLPPGMRLDLGGIAKGWAADEAARRLGALGPALVDAGGDIAVHGRPRGLDAWPIDVADPHAPEESVALLALAQGGVATSGRDYRRWERGGAPQHHIIDPRTGRPAETDVLSATVVGPTAEEAEVAAKVVLILGCRAGLEWLEARPALAGLIVLDGGAVIDSRRMAYARWN
jgi:thiamine biosynthesis lipoprotein